MKGIEDGQNKRKSNYSAILRSDEFHSFAGSLLHKDTFRHELKIVTDVLKSI